MLGKLLNAVGPDNVLWGTDGIWYGPTQGAVDTFRAFQIPEWMRETYGYPELTPELKQKILGMNADKRVRHRSGDRPAAPRHRRPRLDQGCTRGVPSVRHTHHVTGCNQPATSLRPWQSD